MEAVPLLLLLLAGSVAGFFSRLFGPAGGMILIPLVIACLQSSGISSLVATHLALGTALLVYGSVSAAGIFRSRGEAQLRAASVVFLSAGGMVGAITGALAAGTMRESTLQQIFAAFLVLAVVQLIGDVKKARKELEAVGVRLFATGLTGGVVASWSGAGGEAVFQRTLYSYLGFPLKRSQLIARAGIVCAAFAGAAGFAVLGRGEPLLPPGTVGFVGALQALPLFAGFLVSDRLGMIVAERAKPLLRKMYAVILLVVAAKMFLV